MLLSPKRGKQIWQEKWKMTNSNGGHSIAQPHCDWNSWNLKGRLGFEEVLVTVLPLFSQQDTLGIFLWAFLLVPCSCFLLLLLPTIWLLFPEATLSLWLTFWFLEKGNTRNPINAFSHLQCHLCSCQANYLQSVHLWGPCGIEDAPSGK
jgi:hypothetical protein